MEKLFRQTGICLIILLSVFILQDLNITAVNKGLAACYRQINQNHEVKEIASLGVKAVETIKGTKSVITNAISPVMQDQYGEPIDAVMQPGAVSCVYAVSGGTVIATGEDEQLGKFIKIAHGSEAQSIYGQCSAVYVQPLERIKKGQIIAEYTNGTEQEFYYTLSYL